MTKLGVQQIKLNEMVENNFGRVAVISGRDTIKTGTIMNTHYLPTSKYGIYDSKRRHGKLVKS